MCSNRTTSTSNFNRRPKHEPADQVGKTAQNIGFLLTIAGNDEEEDHLLRLLAAITIARIQRLNYQPTMKEFTEAEKQIWNENQ